MKKLIFLLLILCMSAVLTACRSDQAGYESSEDVDAPLTVDGDLFPPLEEISSDPGKVSEEEASSMEDTENPSSVSGDETGSSYGPKTGQFAKMMASGQYRMQFDVKFTEEDLNVKTHYDMALSSGKFYMKISVDNPENNALLSALETVTILKDGKIYVFNPSVKTYLVTAGNLLDAGAIGVKGLTFTESGKEDGLEYEEYATSDGGTLRYYVDGQRLVRFSSATEDRTLEAENITLTSDVSESLFDIPSGYTKVG